MTDYPTKADWDFILWEPSEEDRRLDSEAYQEFGRQMAINHERRVLESVAKTFGLPSAIINGDQGDASMFGSARIDLEMFRMKLGLD